MASVLVIDDDIEFRTTLIALLTKHNYDVFGAQDGLEGIDRFRTLRCDVVITDLCMPRKDGLQAIVKLKEEQPDLRIIAITGVSDSKESLLDAARQVGAHGVLAKPFSCSDLLTTIQSVLSV